jgi:predicted DNA-binding protein with PD1-like motif
MHSEQVTLGRTFGIRFDDGEDFFESLIKFCGHNGIRQGFIPSFLAGFSEAEIVGTCERVHDPRAPIWAPTYLTNLDALGCGTIAYDEAADAVSPHVHVTVGRKAQGADGFTSHLLRGTVQFLVEMLLIEVSSPEMSRPVHSELYDVPLLTFGQRGVPLG